MRRLLVCVLTISLVLGFPTIGFAAGPPASSGEWKWFWEGGEKKWLPQFELTARPGNHHFHGMEMDPLFPIGQSDRGMAYINPRGSTFWDHGDFLWELNVGGGYRHIMGDDSWILGGYGFYDRIDTRWDNTFNQGTLGVEAMAWDWDARVNGYIADNDAKSAFGAGGSQVSLSGTNLSMQTMQEQALSGLDGEVGWRIPFFGDDGVFSDMRIYAGGFWFDDGSVAEGYGGPSARFEHRIWDVPFMPAESRVVLGANYTWDDVRQSRVQGIIALRVPLGRAHRSQPLTHLERRMTDRVVRDVNVQTNTGLGGTEDVMTRTGVTIEDAIFFDEDGGGDGSFENPYDLPTAVGTGENNLLIGLARTGDIDVSFGEGDLLNGQTVLGGGMPLYVWGVDSGQDGVWVAPGQAATLCCTGTALTLAENNTVAGLFFRNMGRAIELNLDNQSTLVDIYNNHFSQMEHAIEIDAMNDSALTAWIWKNSFERQESGVDVWAPDTFDLTFNVWKNDFSNMGTGMEFTLQPDGSAGASSFALNAFGNQFADVDSGISTDVYFTGAEDYTHMTKLGYNTFWNVRYDDYELDVEGNNPAGSLDAMVTLKGNESLNGDTFADIEVYDVRNGSFGVMAYGNSVTGAEDGILVDVYQGPDVTAMITGNEMVGVGREDDNADAIRVSLYESGSDSGHEIVINENWLENIQGDAIDVEVDFSYDANIEVAYNTIRDVTQYDDDDPSNGPIEIDIYDSGHDVGHNVMVHGNDIQFVENENAIDVDIVYSYDANVEITENRIRDVISNDSYNADGISVTFYDTGHDGGNNLVIGWNDIARVGSDGVDVQLDELENPFEAITVSVTENQIRRTSHENDGEEDGIEITLDTVSDSEIIVSGNMVDHADDGDNGFGVWIDLEDSDGNMVEISENSISRSGEHGVEIDLHTDSYDNTVAINQNHITLSDENGI